MSFFASNEKQALEQKSLTFNSINGLNYTENGKIVIEIPGETCQFFDPEQSYLRFNATINTNSPDKNYLIQVDPYLGAQILIKDIRVYNLQGVLLEELVDVNTLTNLMEAYSDTSNNQNKAGLTTGQVLYNPEQRTWAPNNVRIEQSRETNSQYNPWFTKSATGQTTYNTVPICLKLPSAIFSSKRIWANETFGGLRIELICSENKDCFKLLRNASPGGMLKVAQPDAESSYYLPVLDHVGALGQATGFDGGAGKQTQIFLGWKNNQNVNQLRCPFCVGEEIRIAESAAAFIGGTITAIDYIEIAAGPPSVKQIRITVDTIGPPTVNIPAGTPIYSVGFNNRGAGKDPTFLISDVNMVIQQIMPEPSYISAMQKAMKENGGLVYKCHSWANYRHSVGPNENTATANLNILQQKAIALMVGPIKQGGVTVASSAVEYGGYRTNVSGVMDTVSSLQYFYGGGEGGARFQPDRAIDTKKVSDETLEVFNGSYLCELEKSLAFFGVPSSHTMLNIKKNMVYPRALALMSQVVNLSDSDFQIIVNYSAPTVSKLLHCWIAGVREFKATSGGVVVSY